MPRSSSSIPPHLARRGFENIPVRQVKTRLPEFDLDPDVVKLTLQLAKIRGARVGINGQTTIVKVNETDWVAVETYDERIVTGGGCMKHMSWNGSKSTGIEAALRACFGQEPMKASRRGGKSGRENCAAWMCQTQRGGKIVVVEASEIFAVLDA